jgi:ribonuclease BN (tRNA processing enzyme)
MCKRGAVRTIVLLAASVVGLAIPTIVLGPSADDPAETVSKVVLLGTGTPNAEPNRAGSCVAVVVNDASYLVDFGPGVVRRATAAYMKGIKALRPEKLTRAFVTHLHSDHTSGYPDLILTPWVLGRNEPLEVYGPEGIVEMTDHILEAYQQDIHMRLYGLETAPRKGCKVNAHEIEQGIIYEDSNVTVEAFPVRHGSWPQAFGYKFTTPDRTIVISGDTVPTAALVHASTGCDVLVHEVYAVEGFNKRSVDWQRYHANYHTSSYELAGIASDAKPKLLVLYHQLYWGTSEEDLLSEIRERYDGVVVSGHDLDVF